MVEELTDHDIHQATLTRGAAMAIGEWLIESSILEKRVRELHMPELEAIAVAALSGYILTKNRILTESRRSDSDRTILVP